MDILPDRVRAAKRALPGTRYHPEKAARLSVLGTRFSQAAASSMPILVYSLLRPLLFALGPSYAHALVLSGLRLLEHSAGLRDALRAPATPAPARTRCMGIDFPNPIGIAGGFDKNGVCPRALEALGFGFLEIGTVTSLPQAANPRPNLFRLPRDRAIINRLGFPNDGAEAVARRLRAAKPTLGIPMGVSIGKSRSVSAEDLASVVNDYSEALRAVRDVADFVVINVSSPNTPNLRTLQQATLAEKLLLALVQENSRGDPRPLLLKVSPDTSNEDLAELFRVVEQCGLAGIVATNTTTSRTNLRTNDTHASALGPGGLSGPPLFSRAGEVVRLAREKLASDKVIVGVGGIDSPARAAEMFAAGANLLQIYTSLVYEGPGIVRQLVAASAAQPHGAATAPDRLARHEAP